MCSSKPRKIVLTGGPGAGKTTAVSILRRELGEKIVVVPEAATMLFMGGFPRVNEPFAIESAQKAIFHVQRNLENVQASRFPNRTLLCDRGTLDSSVYWPTSPQDFLKQLDTTFEHELNQYDAVVFFESAAVGNINIIEDGNPTRHESLNEALTLNQKLKDIWSKHNNFTYIPHEKSFMKKLQRAHECILKLICNDTP